MTAQVTIQGRTIAGGLVEGEAVVTREPFMFPHGLDPKTGRVINRRHELFGRDLSGKILIFPFAVGSTTTATWLLEAVRLKKNPKALLVEEIDPMLAVGAILAEIFYQEALPVIDFPKSGGFSESPVSVFATGDWLIVDGDKGIVKRRE